MFKRNQIIKSLFVSGLVVATSASYAQDPINTDATVTVQNTFAFAQDAALSFGTLRASADSSAADLNGAGAGTGITVATYTVRPDGAATIPVVRVATSAGAAVDGTELTPASISVLATGTPASYTVSGASPFTAIEIVALGTSDNTTLLNPLAPPSAPTFTVDQFLFEEVGTAGVGSDEATASFDTDVNGEVSFNVGATISTPTTATAVAYADGTYTGSFTVEVGYQ